MRSQRLRRVVQFQLPDGLFPRLALAILPAGDLELILDRSNWNLGQQDINILLLSAVWSGFSLPLMWTILPHGGSSSQALRHEWLIRIAFDSLTCERIKRAERGAKNTLCAVWKNVWRFPGRSVIERNAYEAFSGGLPGSEDHRSAGRPAGKPHTGAVLPKTAFVGKTWFAFLDQHRIPPCIRLPASATVGTGGLPIWACFKTLQPGEDRRWHRPIRVYGVLLRICATKNMAGEILYLAYRGRAGITLERYSRRWQAENLHAALNSRGLGLEDTGVTQAERISTVLTAVSIAFIWACVTGELLAAKTAPKVKKHGHRTVSVFRLGLDHLQDLLLHPSRASWRALNGLMPSFDW